MAQTLTRAPAGSAAGEPGKIVNERGRALPIPISTSSAAELKASVQVLTFDLYGTIVDMQGGLTDAVTPYLAAKGWSGSPGSFVTWWRRTHFENSMIDALIDRGHTPYREIGRRALTLTLERAGIRHTQNEVHVLVSHIERLRPFDDVVESLGRLKVRYKLVILSNGDPDMLENAGPHIGFAFDRYISIASAGYFKPHRVAYRAAAEMLRTPIDRILHVANHPFDCIGAQAAGMKAAFINRRGRPYEESPYQPDVVVGNFRELADVMT
jgi:2-haloacid dehalogenase